ncbi:MAG: hypothetical protein ACRDWA_18485 [Acidimicrobiia bacterium]
MAVVSVAADLGVAGQTIYSGRRQALIDTGTRPGLSIGEQAELAAAPRWDRSATALTMP